MTKSIVESLLNRTDMPKIGNSEKLTAIFQSVDLVPKNAQVTKNGAIH
jgi:hypothetical protein